MQNMYLVSILYLYKEKSSFWIFFPRSNLAEYALNYGHIAVAFTGKKGISYWTNFKGPVVRHMAKFLYININFSTFFICWSVVIK
jgi:hypothetical protein